MTQLNPNKTGFTVGSFYAICHFAWVLMVAAGLAKPFLDWVFSLHFLSIPYSVNTFQIVPAVMLIAFAFVGGYVAGWVLASLWNAFHK